MDAFFKDLFNTYIVITFGRTDAAIEKMTNLRTQRLLYFILTAGLLLGIQMSIQTGVFLKIIGVPIFLLCLPVVLSFVFVTFGNVKREELLDIYSIFLASSLLFIPGIIPIIGPIFLQVLMIAYPFYISRFLADKLKRPPGKVFFQLVLPIVILWILLILLFYIFGKFFISPLNTINVREVL